MAFDRSSDGFGSRSFRCTFGGGGIRRVVAYQMDLMTSLTFFQGMIHQEFIHVFFLMGGQYAGPFANRANTFQ